MAYLKQRTWSQQQMSDWTSQKQRSGQRRGFLRWCQQSMTWQRGSWKHEWHSSRLTRKQAYIKDMCGKINKELSALSQNVLNITWKYPNISRPLEDRLSHLVLILNLNLHYTELVPPRQAFSDYVTALYILRILYFQNFIIFILGWQCQSVSWSVAIKLSSEIQDSWSPIPWLFLSYHHEVEIFSFGWNAWRWTVIKSGSLMVISLMTPLICLILWF